MDFSPVTKSACCNAQGCTDPDNFSHLEILSPEVRRRVCALKKLQVEGIKIEADFYGKIHDLEKEFQARFNQVNAKRSDIISGKHNPTAEESDALLLHSMPEEELKKLEDEWNKNESDANVTGIPDFWLNVLKGNPSISDMINETDEPILKHLVDITTEVSSDPQSFTLHFHFSPNEYFTNSVLTKTYQLSTEIDEEEPFAYGGPHVVSVKGCKINWAEGKDLAQLEEDSAKPSVFHFFGFECGDANSADDDQLMEMNYDYEIGEAFRDEIIPRAVLFYTGEQDDACDDSYFDDEEMGSDEEDEEADSDDEEH